MAKYNLIRNGYFDSLTISGTGNVDLNWAQLESLMDGNLTSSGVTLTAPDVLYLETDLSQRIKVDGIRLYASDLSKSSDIKFYYKNLEGDSYTGLTTYSGASYYYTIIASPSAPRYMRVTISGVAMEVYEFQIFNDDYIVAFGEDGSQYSEYLDNTPVGEVGPPEVIKLFNNDAGSTPANAYACIDYTGNAGDLYVKISASENGTYYGISDGVLLQDNSVSSTYIWDMGQYGSNVGVENGSLVLIDPYILIAKDKLCDLPLTDGSEALNVGSSAMAYDSVNEVIYVLGCEASPTVLKLYKYDIATNNWTYLWEVNPGVTGYENNAGICYLDGYVYIMCNYSSYDFGRCDVTTSGVWEPLATLSGTVPTATSTAFSIDSDGVDCVYLASVDGLGAPGTTTFQRYNTVSGTWSILDDGFGRYIYGGTGDWPCTMSISYDTDRDFIYSIAGEYNLTYGYVSRYDVSTDTWLTDYVNRTTLGGDPFKSCVAYYKDYIVLYGYDYTPTAYLYHIPSDTSRSVDVGEPTIHADGPHWNTADFKSFMCAINPSSGDDTISIIFGCVLGYVDELYGYNVSIIYDVSDNYVSPIFKMYDRYSSSYFTNEDTTTSGFNSISYDVGSYNGTIRIKSSNVEPMEINEIYWTVESPGNTEVYLYRYNFDTGAGGNWMGTTILPANTENAGNTDVDRRTGHIAATCSRYYTGKGDYNEGQINIYNRAGAILHTKTSTRDYRLDRHLSFDKLGGLWGYEGATYHLLHFDYQLASVLADVSTGSDFLYDMAVEMDGTGVWHTDSINETLVHRYSNGTIAHNIQLTTPRAVCGTNDNGCWVIDNTDYYARRYLSDGTISKSVYLGISATRMCADYNDGFWYYNGTDTKVRHVNSTGTELVSVIVAGVSRMKAMNSGCMVWSQTGDYVKWINNDGVVVRTINGPTSTTFCAGVFSHGYDDYVNYQTDHLPLDIDPVWGTSGSAEWREVRKSGYFLPKNQYHQSEYTLRTDAAVSPKLDSVIIAPTIKVQDIVPQSSKDMYVRTDIPGTVDPEDYETRLKVWWGIEE